MQYWFCRVNETLTLYMLTIALLFISIISCFLLTLFHPSSPEPTFLPAVSWRGNGIIKIWLNNGKIHITTCTRWENNAESHPRKPPCIFMPPCDYLPRLQQINISTNTDMSTSTRNRTCQRTCVTLQAWIRLMPFGIYQVVAMPNTDYLLDHGAPLHYLSRPGKSLIRLSHAILSSTRSKPTSLTQVRCPARVGGCRREGGIRILRGIYRQFLWTCMDGKHSGSSRLVAICVWFCSITNRFVLFIRPLVCSIDVIS